ncbi:MAG TPA: helix-turn-helix transcriptional regulator [Actinophytocola sp.]|uniref:helix-turn-helix domain-containing protein n=1 Tax=Actinophytocola sp. TaxID=1872138 RepID=UPI002DC03458|nr:helix-turn-helix transcriptional regulator [Actinophytocola sp.]HEU5470576.1 helix-turn-helix transcriptional regulator [Actinophytocola sp.]
MTVLLREAIGDRLRHARTNQRRTLREVSRSARVSLGYLSEVERGRKEASSELLAAICDALELPLAELLHNVASDLDVLTAVPDAVPDPVPPQPEPAGPATGRREPAPRASVDSVDAGRLVPAVVGDSLADLRIQPALSHRLPTALSNTRAGVVFAA